MKPRDRAKGTLSSCQIFQAIASPRPARTRKDTISVHSVEIVQCTRLTSLRKSDCLFGSPTNTFYLSIRCGITTWNREGVSKSDGFPDGMKLTEESRFSKTQLPRPDPYSCPTYCFSSTCLMRHDLNFLFAWDIFLNKMV
jgi:hypothetical protein